MEKEAYLREYKTTGSFFNSKTEVTYIPVTLIGESYYQTSSYGGIRSDTYLIKREDGTLEEVNQSRIIHKLI